MFTDGKFTKKKYWNLNDEILKTDYSFDESSKLIESKLKNSIKYQLTSMCLLEFFYLADSIVA